MKLKNIFFVLALFAGFIAQAQDCTIRGFVKSKEKGEPILMALVALEGTTVGNNTDENGYFSLTKLQPGTYYLFVKVINFNEYRDTITVKQGQLVSTNILLESGSNIMGILEINDQRSEQINNVNISSETLRPKDFKRVPSFGGQTDIVQVLTTLPGFISTGDQGGQVFVRGGSPVQNKVVLDGMIVYNPFHSIGLFSVFDTDIISNADVYTGGFGAQFGGRISSVIDITTRDGNKKGHDGKIGFSPFGGKVQLEGPLKKLTKSGSGISYILSAKNSYLDKTSPQVYPFVNDGNGLPFSYTDLYGKLSFGGSNGSKFNLFGFSFDDKVTKYQALSNLNWKNVGAGGNFVVVPTSSPVLINGNFAWSKYNILLQEESVADRKSGITSFNFGLDFNYSLGKDAIKYGVEVVGFSTNYNTFNPLGVRIDIEQNTTELNGFISYKYNRKKLIIEPGFRVQYYSALSAVSPEPRIGMKYRVNERLRLKTAAGLYSQNLMATNSDRDIVNLFYGFLASPDEIQNTITRPDGTVKDVTNSLQKASHLVTGFEFDITDELNLNVEGYLRNFKQVTNTNRNKIFPDDADNQDKPELLRKDFILESGFAKGVDVVLKYATKHSNVNVVYSIMNVDRWDGLRWYDPVFDRRHNVNVVASHSWGKNDSWEMSARWNLGSGLPFTQTQGGYEPPTLSGGISTDYIYTNSSTLGIQYAPLNEGRLPWYHRLDANIRKTFKWEKSTLEMNFGLTNAYNRANVFYIDRVTSKRVNQLPMLPSIGIEMSF